MTNMTGLMTTLNGGSHALRTHGAEAMRKLVPNRAGAFWLAYSLLVASACWNLLG
jgi:hypothetical protein